MGYNLTEYSQLNQWYKRLQSLPSFEENLSGAKFLADLMRKVVDDALF
jgi:hypothetical protein